MNPRPLLVLAPALVATVLAPLPAGASGVPWCGNADLRASYVATDAATSHRFGQIVLRNVSHHACRTGGYDGLSYVGHGNGTQIGAAATRDPAPHRVLTLQPGQRARSAVSETVAGVYSPATCHPVHVDGFRVYVPDSTRSQFVAHPTTGCANSAVHLLSHRPYARR